MLALVIGEYSSFLLNQPLCLEPDLLLQHSLSASEHGSDCIPTLKRRASISSNIYSLCFRYVPDLSSCSHHLTFLAKPCAFSAYLVPTDNDPMLILSQSPQIMFY